MRRPGSKWAGTSFSLMVSELVAENWSAAHGILLTSVTFQSRKFISVSSSGVDFDEGFGGASSSSAFESDSVAASRSPTPDVVCSQYRLQQLEEGILASRYPTPPAAPPKDGYFAESEDESQSSLRQAPARVFRNGKLKIHKTYNGPVPLTYVDTGVYEGGGNDYYEVHTQEDLCWARRMNFVMKHHRIPRWNVE